MIQPRVGFVSGFVSKSVKYTGFVSPNQSNNWASLGPDPIKCITFLDGFRAKVVNIS